MMMTAIVIQTKTKMIRLFAQIEILQEAGMVRDVNNHLTYIIL